MLPVTAEQAAVEKSSEEPTPEAATLGEVLAEMRAMRAEQARREEAQAARNNRQEEELQRLRSQLSPPNNSALQGGDFLASGARRQPDNYFARAERFENAGASANAENRGIRLKPDTYDGTVPLREFLAQFSIIAHANFWSEAEKGMVLASCLRGKARSLLDSCADSGEMFSFSELKRKLELRFGESELSQNFYLQFTNRRQLPGEDFPTLGAELERLSRKAYPECSHEVRDKLACSQFVAGLTDGFVKRSLLVEGVNSLRLAVERAKTLKFINANSFAEKKIEASRGFRVAQSYLKGESGNLAREDKRKEGKQTLKFKNRSGSSSNGKECWQCGAVGHFRAECPSAGRAEN